MKAYHALSHTSQLRRVVYSLAMLLALWPAPSLAQVPGDLGAATLEELMKVTVTTASRRAEGLADAPAMVEVVTARQIRSRGYRSLSDLLRDQLGFKVDIGGDQDYPSELTIQGTRGTSRVVLLLDGIRVNSPTGEPLPIMANYPVHNARQVEIVYGPASALYGADAFSAVINVISKDASEIAGVSFESSFGQNGLYNQSGSFGQRVGQNGSLVVSAQIMSDRQPDLSRVYPDIFGGMQAQRTGTFATIFGPMTSGQVVSPEYAAPIAAHSAHAAFRLGGLQLSLFKNMQRASNSSGYTPDNAVYNAEANQQNDLWVASGAYVKAIGQVTATSTVTLSRQTLSPNSGYWNVYSNLKKSFKYAYGSMMKVEEQLSWKPFAKIVMTTGATYESFYSIPQGADLNAPIQSHDAPGTILDTTIVDEFTKARYANTGGYAQVQYALSSRLSFTAGARGDYNTRFGGTFNPRVSIVAKPARRTTLKALYGTAYLAPSPYQATAHYGSFYSTDNGATYASDYWHVGNPNLKPQNKSTVQASILQSLSPVLNLSASVFHSRITNLVKHSDPELAGPGIFLGWPVAYMDFPVNQGKETLNGATADLDFMKSWSGSRRLSARVGVSVADGRGWETDLTGPGQQIGTLAPFQFRAGTDIDWGAWTGAAKLMAFGRQRLIATEDAGATSARKTLPGFTTLDLHLRRNRVVRNIDAFISVENALDARYFHINERAYVNAEELIGAPQNPRRVTAGFAIRLGQ